eukprot:TRINITY_DN5526_c2_g2_i2.p1 TRINITY_DN5526_c2_g2~~TRINITY_DN5526_c2_g2_i2.p1  ORF type:complete len:1460 (+),score=297.36 TRINITY_DN5526_c2_g2_i2:138-4517(+)
MPEADDPGIDGSILIGGGSVSRALRCKLSQFKLWNSELPTSAVSQTHKQGVCAGWTPVSMMFTPMAIYQLDSTLSKSVDTTHGGHHTVRLPDLMAAGSEEFKAEKSCPANPCPKAICSSVNATRPGLRSKRWTSRLVCALANCTVDECCEETTTLQYGARTWFGWRGAEGDETLGQNVSFNLDIENKFNSSISSSRSKWAFLSPTDAAGQVNVTHLYIQPPQGSERKAGECVQYGDEVILAASASREDTVDCGLYGCSVATVTKNDSWYMRFDKGGESPTSFFVRAMPDRLEDHGCVKSGGLVVLALSDDKGKNSICGWYGCLVAEPDQYEGYRLRFGHGGLSLTPLLAYRTPPEDEAFLERLEERRREKAAEKALFSGNKDLEKTRVEMTFQGADVPYGSERERLVDVVKRHLAKATKIPSNGILVEVRDMEAAYAEAYLGMKDRRGRTAQTRRPRQSLDWVLGSSGESCDRACSRRLGNCDVQLLRSMVQRRLSSLDDLEVYNVSGLSCGSITSTGNRGLPFVSDDNICAMRQQEESIDEPTCDAKPPEMMRRICPCRPVFDDFNVRLGKTCSGAKRLEREASKGWSPLVCARECQRLGTCTGFDKKAEGCVLWSGKVSEQESETKDCYMKNALVDYDRLAGQDCPGKDLKTVLKSTADECAAHCTAIGDECAGFVRVDEDDISDNAGECYLRSKHGLKKPQPADEFWDCYLARPTRLTKQQTTDTKASSLAADLAETVSDDVDMEPPADVPAEFSTISVFLQLNESVGEDAAEEEALPDEMVDSTVALIEQSQLVTNTASAAPLEGFLVRITVLIPESMNESLVESMVDGEVGTLKEKVRALLNIPVDASNNNETDTYTMEKVEPLIPRAPCVYDTCPVVLVEHAGSWEANGYYYAQFPTCKDETEAQYGSEYGRLVLPSSWRGYVNRRTGAQFSFIWDESDSRGWAIEVKGDRLYFDKRNKPSPKDVVVGFESYATQYGSAKDPPPRVQCQKLSREMRPLLAVNATIFVTFLGLSLFDGVTYYDLADQAPFNLGGSITIMFTAQWHALGSWSRILDFGNDQADSNIVVGNCAESSSLCFSHFVDGKEMMLEIPRAIELGRQRTWLLTSTRNGTMRAWRDAVEMGVRETGVRLMSTWRAHLYIGRSMWTQPRSDAFFRGTIQDLRVWQGESYGWGEDLNWASPTRPENAEPAARAPVDALVKARDLSAGSSPAPAPEPLPDEESVPLLRWALEDQSRRRAVLTPSYMHAEANSEIGQAELNLKVKLRSHTPHLRLPRHETAGTTSNATNVEALNATQTATEAGNASNETAPEAVDGANLDIELPPNEDTDLDTQHVPQIDENTEAAGEEAPPDDPAKAISSKLDEARDAEQWARDFDYFKTKTRNGDDVNPASQETGSLLQGDVQAVAASATSVDDGSTQNRGGFASGWSRETRRSRQRIVRREAGSSSVTMAREM